MTTQEFYAAYERLSEHGYCDDAGGMEYQGALDAWQEAGCPDDVDAFIKHYANNGPEEAVNQDEVQVGLAIMELHAGNHAAATAALATLPVNMPACDQHTAVCPCQFCCGWREGRRQALVHVASPSPIYVV